VTRVAVLADLHGRLPEPPACDLLVLAGDACALEPAAEQRAWVEAELRPWLERAGTVVGIAGNCDLAFDQDPALPRSLPWLYLENEPAEVAGLRLFGSPLALPFGPWPFMAPEERLAEVWAQVPDATELLVVHGPPHGLGDRASNGVDAGSTSLTARLAELPRLRAVVFGHIHEARGRGSVGRVEWVNAAAPAGEEPFFLDL
jgi:Icc-related predicted phosphoesterase